MVGEEEAEPRPLRSALDPENLGSHPAGPLSSWVALGKLLLAELGWGVGASLQLCTGSDPSSTLGDHVP